MSISSAQKIHLAPATCLYDGGNLQPIFFARQRVFTIVTVLEPIGGAFPARLLPKTRAANQNLPAKLLSPPKLFK